MIKGYIAGKLNDTNAVGYIKNLHRMVKTSEIVRRHGFSVYVPGIDILIGIIMGDLDYSDYFNNSQPWLLASDFVFLTPGWEDSEGTNRELQTAKENNIPVFSSITSLLEYFKGKDKELK